MTLVSSFSRWDDVSWHSEPDYSRAAVPVLKAGHLTLGKSPKNRATYLKIFNTLVGLLDVPLCAHQREHLTFLLSTGLMADQEYIGALFHLNEAIDLALSLDELGDACELLQMRASALRAISKFKEASGDLYDCMSIWNEYALQTGDDINQLVGPERQLHVITQLAGYEYFAARFEDARELISQGRMLLPVIADEASRAEFAATLEWAEALLYRMQGKPELALQSALAAHQHYAVVTHPASRLRLHFLVAAAALDIAETLPAGASRDEVLATHALPHVRLGEGLMDDAHDPAGSDMALLARIRVSRLLQYDENRVSRIEAIVHHARDIGDEAVLAEALTALGDEFAALDKINEAMSYYRDALKALDGSEAVVLKMPVRLKLRRLETLEIRTDKPHE